MFRAVGLSLECDQRHQESFLCNRSMDGRQSDDEPDRADKNSGRIGAGSAVLSLPETVAVHPDPESESGE